MNPNYNFLPSNLKKLEWYRNEKIAQHPIWKEFFFSESNKIYRVDFTTSKIQVLNYKVKKFDDITPFLGRSGYQYFSVRINGKKAIFCHHKMKIQAFKGMRSKEWACNHKDGNKLNNHINNLEYVTYSQNISHAYELGLRSDNKPVEVYRDGIYIQTIRSKRQTRALYNIPEKRLNYALETGLPFNGFTFKYTKR